MEERMEEGINHFSLLKFSEDVRKKIEGSDLLKKHGEHGSVPRTVRKSFTYENVAENPSLSLRFLHKPSRSAEMLEKASDKTKENSVWNATIGGSEHQRVREEIERKKREREQGRTTGGNSSPSGEKHSHLPHIPEQIFDKRLSSRLFHTKPHENHLLHKLSRSKKGSGETSPLEALNTQLEKISTNPVHTNALQSEPLHTDFHSVLNGASFCDPGLCGSAQNSEEKNTHATKMRAGKNGKGGEEKSENKLEITQNGSGSHNTKSDSTHSSIANPSMTQPSEDPEEDTNPSEPSENSSENSSDNPTSQTQLTSDEPLSLFRKDFFGRPHETDAGAENMDPLQDTQEKDEVVDRPEGMLVRKKSGEILKSSLKFGKSRSLPSTPTYKQVHFGCSNDVRYFKVKDKPTAISASNSPNPSDEDDDDEDDEDMDDYFSRGHGTEKITPYPYQQTNWTLRTLNFPALSYPAKINSNAPVFLERVFISMDKRFVMGHIAVKNLAYEKDICLRYSPDESWSTIVEIPTRYSPDRPGILKEHNYDRFSFQIPLDTLFSSSASDKVEKRDGCVIRSKRYHFCVKYHSASQEYWDNNSFKNYAVELVKSTKSVSPHQADTQIRAHNAKPKYSSSYMKRRVSDSSIPKKDVPELTPPTSASSISSNFYIHDDMSDGDFSKNGYYLSSPLLADLYSPSHKGLTKKEQWSEPEKKKGSYDKHYEKPFLGESAMSSKSYKELLDKYCFFSTDRNDDVYAVSSFLT